MAVSFFPFPFDVSLSTNLVNAVFRYDENVNGDKKDCILYQLQKLFSALIAGSQPFASTAEPTRSFQWDYK